MPPLAPFNRKTPETMAVLKRHNSKVLILNQDFTALGVCSIPKAFLLVYLDKAEMVSEDEEAAIRTVNDAYPLPTIIRLLSYVNLPYRGGVVLSRQNVFRRDGGSCQYCGTRRHLTIDHVVPRSRGGKSTWANLTTACRDCNSRKGNRTPEEAAMPLMEKPFKPSFVMFLREFNGRIRDEWMLYLGQRRN